MKYGLKESIINQLKKFFSQYNFIDDVMIFGSRGRGDYSHSSDIDIAIFSKTMTSSDFSKLKFKLDELPILHKIDIIHFEKVDITLQNNILKFGKRL
jgi:proline iminopeptidase